MKLPTWRRSPIRDVSPGHQGQHGYASGFGREPAGGTSDADSVSDDEGVTDFDYKGWHVRLRPKMAPGVGQWYAHALLVRTDPSGLRIQPLGFREAGTFPGLTDANRAAADLARAWIDRQGRGGAE
jgi:hypothetical protein